MGRRRLATHGWGSSSGPASTCRHAKCIKIYSAVKSTPNHAQLGSNAAERYAHTRTKCVTVFKACRGLTASLHHVDSTHLGSRPRPAVAHDVPAPVRVCHKRGATRSRAREDKAEAHGLQAQSDETVARQHRSFMSHYAASAGAMGTLPALFEIKTKQILSPGKSPDRTVHVVVLRLIHVRP